MDWFISCSILIQNKIGHFFPGGTLSRSDIKITINVVVGKTKCSIILDGAWGFALTICLILLRWGGLRWGIF